MSRRREVDSLTEFNSFIVQYPQSGRGQSPALLKILHKFIRSNENPQNSPNLRNEAPDEMKHLVHLLSDQKVLVHVDLVSMLVQICKILSRKDANRASMGQHVIGPLSQIMTTIEDSTVSIQCSLTLLNLCYEAENVGLLIEAGGLLPLIRQLKSENPEIQSSACGALQSICYQKIGRECFVDLNGVAALVPLMYSANQKVKHRALGVVHNLSLSPQSIRLIRESEGISPIISMLRSEDAAVSQTAAGALQNLAREVRSRELILKAEVVEPLTNILVSNHVPAQIAALGALLNLIGPDLGIEGADNSKRAQFKKTLTNCLVLGVLFHSLYSEEDSME